MKNNNARDITELDNVKKSLEKSEASLQAIFDNACQFIGMLSPEGILLHANKSALQFGGLTHADVIGKYFWDTPWWQLPGEKEQLRNDFAQASAGNFTRRTAKAIGAGGQCIIVDFSLTPARDPDGNIFAIIPEGHDITELENTKESLQKNEARFRAIFNGTFQLAALLRADGIVVEINKAALEISGLAAVDILDKPFWDAPVWQVFGETREQVKASVAEAAAGKPVRYNVDIQGAAGHIFTVDFSLTPLHNEQGGIEFIIAEGRDITEHQRIETERIHYLTLYDKLTRLPNRTLLETLLTEMLMAAEAQHKQVAMLQLGLDRFKNINDALGRDIGDQLLQAVAERLKQQTTEREVLARPGGDHFMVVMGAVESLSEVEHKIAQMQQAFTHPFMVGNNELNMSCSIGACLYPHDGVDMASLLRQADTAMYTAKRAHRGSHEFYRPEMDVFATEYFQLEADLHRALPRNEFVLYYQPQIDIKSHRICGTEALIRWQHPTLGLLPPTRFIAIAEEIGLIWDIGKWALATACAQNRLWQNQGLPKISVAVNLSSAQFRHAELKNMVGQVLAQTALDPEYLELELTESMMMQNTEAVIATLAELKSMGLILSIDDFGTGYSSLSYLKRFRIDKLKIDKSFVHDITSDADSAAIAAAIIAMARGLRLKVIAEGVESAEQLAFLKHHHCDEAQGFYFSKAVPADEFAVLLTKNHVSRRS